MRRPAPRRFDIWQERREQTQPWKEGANAIYERDAGQVGEMAEERRAKAAQAEGEAEEQTGNGAHLAGNQFLRVHQNRRERRSQD